MPFFSSDLSVSVVIYPKYLYVKWNKGVEQAPNQVWLCQNVNGQTKLGRDKSTCLNRSWPNWSLHYVNSFLIRINTKLYAVSAYSGKRLKNQR